MEDAVWKDAMIHGYDRTAYDAVLSIRTSLGPLLLETDVELGTNTTRARAAVMAHEFQRLLVRGDRIIGVGEPKTRVHPVTKAMMEVYGIDYEAGVAWINAPHIWHGEPGLIPESVRGVGLRNLGEMIVEHVPMGYIVTENSICLPRKRLPEMALAQCVGRRLRDVVVLPDIDHLDLTIHAASSLDGSFGLSFTVVPDHGHAPLCQASRL